MEVYQFSILSKRGIDTDFPTYWTKYTAMQDPCLDLQITSRLRSTVRYLSCILFLLFRLVYCNYLFVAGGAEYWCYFLGIVLLADCLLQNRTIKLEVSLRQPDHIFESRHHY